jgi:hypothetical protein
MIDDARLFLSPSPKPHNFLNWPSIADIVRISPDNFDIIIYEDVIYIIPKNVSTRFRNYLQGKISKQNR